MNFNEIMKLITKKPVVHRKPDSASTGRIQFPPCPFCGEKLNSDYSSVGTTLYCDDGCHGQFTFPAFNNEVLEMWQRHRTATPSGGGREWHPLIPPSGGGEWAVKMDDFGDGWIEAKHPIEIHSFKADAQEVAAAHNASIKK